MRIGAHVSSAGGPTRVFGRALAIGAEAVQRFISPPQQWRVPPMSEEQVAAFRAAHAEARIPVFFHAVYLVNLGTEDPGILERSAISLTEYVRRAGEMGVTGTVFHVGSHLGSGFEPVLQRACSTMRAVLEAAPNDSLLIMENNAGQGGGIGTTFAELGQLIRGLDNDPRVAVCLDTCHAFAMGYNIATKDGCQAAVEEFDREIGLGRLVAVHANDSKMPLGGIRDRHENIGDGHIGLDGFRCLMSNPAFTDVPFFLEVPGLDNKGPDAENIERLKRIRDELGIAPPLAVVSTP